MRIIYRASPFLSHNPNPLGDDKYKIITTCLQSFLNFCDFPNNKITFVLDRIPEQWMNQFSPYGEIVVGRQGNVETFHQQLDIASQLPDDEKVLICEDDYLWRENCIKDLINSLDVFDFVSPYDHPGHYLEPRFQTPKEMKLISGITYRKAPSNTLTFASKAGRIKEVTTHMKSFGLQDHDMWQGLDLWVPCCSFATHLVDGLLAPNIPWKMV